MIIPRAGQAALEQRGPPPEPEVRGRVSRAPKTFGVLETQLAPSLDGEFAFRKLRDCGSLRLPCVGDLERMVSPALEFPSGTASPSRVPEPGRMSARARASGMWMQSARARGFYRRLWSGFSVCLFSQSCTRRECEPDAGQKYAPSEPQKCTLPVTNDAIR